MGKNYSATDQEMSKIIERNLLALLEHRKKQEAKKSAEEKIADHITRFTGSMKFVYVHFLIYGIWIFWNVNLLGLKPFDPTFVILAMAASVEAIFLSTFVLISQNRMNKEAEKRAELDLQVSLLAEHEVTRLITMVNAIAKKLDVENELDSEMDELSKDVKPEKVMDTMEQLSRENNENNSFVSQNTDS